MKISELDELSTMRVSAYTGGYLVRFPVVGEDDDGRSEVSMAGYVCLNRDEIVRKLDMWIDAVEPDEEEEE